MPSRPAKEDFRPGHAGLTDAELRAMPAEPLTPAEMFVATVEAQLIRHRPRHLLAGSALPRRGLAGLS